VVSASWLFCGVGLLAVLLGCKAAQTLRLADLPCLHRGVVDADVQPESASVQR